MTPPPDIDGRSKVARSEAVTTVELDGEAVLYHHVHQDVNVLNVSATLVWQRLDPARELDAIAAELATLVDADPADLAEDVVRTVRELARQGMVDQPEPGSRG